MIGKTYTTAPATRNVVVVPTFGPHVLSYKVNNTKNVMITSTFITMFKRHRFKGTGFKGTQVWV